MLPNSKYDFDDLQFSSVPAFNKLKSFHPRKNNWVGYVINLDNLIFYITGDTDYSYEATLVKCDVLMLPIGGTYTMNFSEAAKLANKIHPKIAIPTHYGTIVGNKDDGNRFKELLDSDIECKLYI